MPEVTTPDSVPSLGDATAASSDTEEGGVKDDVTRVLFPSLHHRKWEDFIARMKAVPARNTERESLFDSDQSILGSDQSVAFLDLAVDASSIVESQAEQSQLPKGHLVRTNRDSKLSDVGVRATGNEETTTQPTVAEKFARFTGPLSASQLVDIFSLCDGGEGVIWSKNPAADEAPPMAERARKNVTIEEPTTTSYSGVSWMPRAESLARECATLKEIIRVDSANILQLRQGLDHLKNINKEQVAQIDTFRNHLLEARNKLDFMEREKEVLELRDAEKQGTIALLKEELDKLSPTKKNWYQEKQEHDFMITDLEQLKFENELFAAQVVENEKQLRAVKQSLKEVELENTDLKQQLELLRASLDKALSTKATTDGEGTPVAAEQLLKQVAILSARFDHGERERMDMALAFDEKLRENEVEIDAIRGLLEHDLEEHRDRIVPVCSVNGDTELQLESAKRSKKKSTKVEPPADKTEPEQKSECGAWRILSDCLPG